MMAAEKAMDESWSPGWVQIDAVGSHYCDADRFELFLPDVVGVVLRPTSMLITVELHRQRGLRVEEVRVTDELSIGVEHRHIDQGCRQTRPDLVDVAQS